MHSWAMYHDWPSSYPLNYGGALVLSYDANGRIMWVQARLHPSSPPLTLWVQARLRPSSTRLTRSLQTLN